MCKYLQIQKLSRITSQWENKNNLFMTSHVFMSASKERRIFPLSHLVPIRRWKRHKQSHDIHHNVTAQK